MALFAVRPDLRPPTIGQTFTNQTGKLHLDVNSGGLAPAGINHLPSRVIIGVRAGGADVITFKDAKGNTFSVQGTTTVPFEVPGTCCAEITVAAASRDVHVFWSDGP